MSLKVKICGITSFEDGALALSLGADELGFVLAPSPRRVEPEALKAMLDELRGDGGLPAFRAIGVFVNETADAMRDIISYCGLDAAQVHGDETPRDCAAFDFPWYRGLRIGSVADANRLVRAGWGCPRILVDAAPQPASATPRGGAAYGGTGKSIGAWAAIAARAHARAAGKEFFVAGGMGPRSVASAIWSLSPDGVDVSSGVEERPGKKSPEKLASFFAEISRVLKIEESEGEQHAAR
jgi:phosphoribosylanthranilate isomerase